MQLLDPKIYGRSEGGRIVGASITSKKLSRQAAAIFDKWPEYLAALNGRRPTAFYITRRQLETLNKSVGNALDYTFDGLPIRLYDNA